MTIKKFIFQLHKILGLATGIVVFVVAVTGCCWAFKAEIESLYSDYDTVMVQDTAVLSPATAREIAKEIFPEKHVHGTLYGKPDQAIEVIFYELEPEFYQSVFLNPYSGEVLHVKDHLSGFFAFVLKGHMRLWLPLEIGEQVVGISILLFVLIIISGFFLWLPKKRKHLKQRITFDWKTTTRWKRKNFDLHAIIGFYVAALALILSITGLVMSYGWFQSAVYTTVGGAKDVTFVIPDNQSPKTEASASILPIDKVFEKVKKQYAAADSFEVHYPFSDTDAIYVEVTNTDGLFYNADFLYFDQNSLQELDANTIYGKYADASVADKILRMNYDIHIGAIGGLLGKILAFTVSLLVASLPVTGTLLWYGRTYKKGKTK
ncbi:PepSY-associated TM helix domain-containing protein [Maribacter sp. X9]|uniref:PepSY-associated TM helix domain-containing protein n=1 Tax=Maribacter sp. X9 TaxID=3402159 RepID=UPI003AF3CF7E